MQININLNCDCNRDEFAPCDIAAIERATEPPEKPRKRSAYARLVEDFGYRPEDTPRGELRLVSDDITSDEKGVDIRYQRVLTVAPEHDNGDSFLARLFVNRRHAFSMHISGGYPRAVKVACGAAVAWHCATGNGKRAE